MVAYKGSDTGESAPYNHGLALAMSDANGGSACQWQTSSANAGHSRQEDSSNIISESGLQYRNATHNSDTYPAFKAAFSNNGTTQPANCSDWFLPSAYQWNQMIGSSGMGSYTALRDAFSSKGGTNIRSNWYWTSTERSDSQAWCYLFLNGTWGVYCTKTTPNSNLVRSALAF